MGKIEREQLSPVFNSELNKINTDLSEKANKTKAAITYYVNATTGNDNNDGLTSETAFKTIQHAVNLIPEILTYDVYIRLASGTYLEDVTIKGHSGCGYLSLIGNSSNNTTYIINKIHVAYNSNKIYLEGFTVTDMVSISACIYAEIQNVINITSSTASYGIDVVYGSTVNINGCTLSNKKAGIRAWASTVTAGNNSGTGNTYGLYSINGAIICKVSANQPTGTTNEITAGGYIL